MKDFFLKNWQHEIGGSIPTLIHNFVAGRKQFFKVRIEKSNKISVLSRILHHS